MTAQELIDRKNRYRKAVAPRGLAAIAIMMLPPPLVWIGLADAPVAGGKSWIMAFDPQSSSTWICGHG